MQVTTVASTRLYWDSIDSVAPGSAFVEQAGHEYDVSEADHLAELAGRACYKSWDRPSPATATTADYLANILRQGHYSVLEHASVTFYVQDVSRSLLLELERHRFLSFSVESQRYVDQEESHPEPVIPPALRGNAGLTGILRESYGRDMAYYRVAASTVMHEGATRKEARETARAFLPNATPVDFVVTGNLRAWRDVLGKRHHVAADAEMREFATEILRHLRKVAPLSVQDIPSTPYGTVTAGERLTTEKVVDVAAFVDWLYSRHEPGDTVKSSDITGWITAHWNEGE